MAETETGQRVGDYEVLAAIGAGGMGRVFKVRNVISNREEAMKVLLPDFASDPDLAARFMTEIRTLAGLEHPGIAQLRTAFQYNNQFVMVMEYVEGTTLEKLAAQTRIPLDHILDYSSQVLAALSYAHGRGVTHRDIKPANIMITTHGLIKLMDFGIAKSAGDMQLTRPGSTMGSVYYMSPEQVRGGTVDGRSDLYSFGVTLYEMLTGRRPFQADTSYSVLDAQLNQPPTPPLQVNPDIPPVLNDIVLRAMAKRPEERFQTADEFRNALKALREPATAPIPQSAFAAPISEPAISMPPTAPQRAQYSAVPQPPPFTPVAMPAAPPRSGNSHRGLWIGLGAATALLALMALAWFVPRILSTHANPKPLVTTAPETPAPAPEPPPATAQQPQTPPTEPPASPGAASIPAGSETQPAPSTTSTPTHTRPASRPAGSKPREAYVPPATTPETGANSSGNGSTAAPPTGPSPARFGKPMTALPTWKRAPTRPWRAWNRFAASKERRGWTSAVTSLRP